MDEYLRTFVEEMNEMPGVKFAAYDERGEFLCGSETYFDKLPAVKDAGEVISRGGATFFKFRFRAKRYTGTLSGSGEAERNYAFFITELAGRDFSKNFTLSREDFFRALVFGEASYFQISRFTRKFSVPDKPACVMIITACGGRAEEVLNVLTSFAGGADCAFTVDEEQCALVKFFDKTSREYASVTEYAGFLCQSVYEETGIRTTVSIGGTASSAAELSTSFMQAQYVKKTGAFLASRGEVHSFKEFTLVRILEDLPEYKRGEYLRLLADKRAREIFEDPEMTDTVEEFLESNLNISETSRNLYLHRNTLMYRLDKIEKATGLDIRKFSDAVIFRLITILTKLSR